MIGLLIAFLAGGVAVAVTALVCMETLIRERQAKLPQLCSHCGCETYLTIRENLTQWHTFPAPVRWDVLRRLWDCGHGMRVDFVGPDKSAVRSGYCKHWVTTQAAMQESREYREHARLM